MTIPLMMLAKVGWSDSYDGSEIIASHKYVKAQGTGSERYNFRNDSGWYYGYIPPIGKSAASPQPKPASGWLVMFIAKHPAGGLYPVGWYENAEFAGRFSDQPSTDEVWCVRARKAFPIPVERRSEFQFASKKLGTTPVAYLRGPGRCDPWREEFAAQVDRIVAACRPRSPNGPKSTAPDQAFVEGAIRDELARRRTRDPRVRRRCLERDGLTCQACGFTARPPVPPTSYIVEVHHIHPIKEGKRATSIEDLLTLCPNCHRTVHAVEALASPGEALGAAFLKRLGLYLRPVEQPVAADDAGAPRRRRR